jgi:hypothetical protein
MTRSIDDIIDDIVSCANAMDGGKVDARAYAAELVDAARAARTCGTYAHWTLNETHQKHWCALLDGWRDSDDGCRKGWTPQETP